MTTLVTPIPGTVRRLSDLSDPVFAQQIVGPGVAVAPDDADQVTAVSPVDGTVFKVQPHAFVVMTLEGSAILVHLGLDTVLLHGTGFHVLVSEGTHVKAGTPITQWDVVAARTAGYDVNVPVIVLQTDPALLHPLVAMNHPVEAGQPLLDIAVSA